MGAFFYFFPDKGAAPVSAFKDAGLGYLFDSSGTSAASASMDPGPNGQRGAVAVGGSPPKPGALSGVDGAEWLDCGDFWVGVDRNNPPTPKDLERAELVDGHAIRLADGNLWMIPVARHYDGATPLPRAVRWNRAQGFHPGDVIKAHRELFAGAEKAWDALLCAMSGDESEFSIDTEFDLLSLTLGTNYRVGPAEIGLLEIVTTVNRSEIVKALVDWPGAEEFLKKKLGCAEPPSGPGAEG